MICGMNRVRISTTVDVGSLERARQLLPGPDSRLLDKALVTLIQKLEADQESAALAAHPYEEDLDLTWMAPAGPTYLTTATFPRK